MEAVAPVRCLPGRDRACGGERWIGPPRVEGCCWVACACGRPYPGLGPSGPWQSANRESEGFHRVFSLAGMDGFLKSDERQRLAKERREEREKCLGELCALAV